MDFVILLFLVFFNSDERNKMVLTDKQKAVIENDFNEKVGTHTKSGRSIRFLNVPTWQFITLSKNSRRLGRQNVVKKATDPLP